jgi:cell division septum initiation protein DivIVA
MRGSSVHFKSITSSLHAVAHASREVEPSYLLPKKHSLGAHVVIDDKGKVSETLAHKSSLASRQAKATKDYSPLWEGVINLKSPEIHLRNDMMKKVEIERQKTTVKKWCDEYEKLTGHKVLRADIHLDEGHMDADGKPQFNAHAHVMLDRTDELGKVLKLDRTALRAVQDITARVTGLQRGEDANLSKRRHVEHQAYRYLAQKGRLNPDLSRLKAQDVVSGAQTENNALKAEIERLKAAYEAERAALKASGEATQKDYQALKVEHLAVLEILKKNPEPTKAIIKSGVYDASIKLVNGGYTGQKLKDTIAKIMGEDNLKTFSASQSDPEKLKADIAFGHELRALTEQVNQLAKDPIQAEKEWERNQERGR